MNLTTEKIIAMLPFTEDFRKELLSELPSMDEDTRYKVGKIVWRGYHVLYEIKLQDNIQKIIASGGAHPGGKLYQDAELQTEKEMENLDFKSSDDQALSEVRSKLEELLSNAK